MFLFCEGKGDRVLCVLMGASAYVQGTRLAALDAVS